MWLAKSPDLKPIEVFGMNRTEEWKQSNLQVPNNYDTSAGDLQNISFLLSEEHHIYVQLIHKNINVNFINIETKVNKKNYSKHSPNDVLNLLSFLEIK